jgi:hypothetical protein
MDFHALLAKMQQIENSPPAQSEGCGMAPSMSPPLSIPPKPETPPPSMSVNLNAQGMDNIESMMKLFQKVNPDMMPKVSSAPIITPMPSISPMKPEIPPMKMLPDFDSNNDSKVGGEMDIDIEPMDKPEDSMATMDLDKDDLDADQPGGLGASLDRDGDGDHDMDDHNMEKDTESDDDDEEDKKEAWANEPEEEEKDIDYMVNKLAGGMNRSQETYPKVAGGDNPMQRVREETNLKDQIKAELRKRLAEAKGAK